MPPRAHSWVSTILWAKTENQTFCYILHTQSGNMCSTTFSYNFSNHANLEWSSKKVLFTLNQFISFSQAEFREQGQKRRFNSVQALYLFIIAGTCTCNRWVTQKATLEGQPEVFILRRIASCVESGQDSWVVFSQFTGAWKECIKPTSLKILKLIATGLERQRTGSYEVIMARMQLHCYTE